MESRFRKLLSLGKSRTEPSIGTSELDLHSIPYTTAQSPATNGRFPVFINHALGRPATAKLKDERPSAVHSFSYNTTIPGTPPEVGERPQRGNGPVKLQTSRRLSSGELLVTQQDYDRTLEDIRHGDFIVGGRQKRISRPPPLSSATGLQQPLFVSTAPNSPSTSSTFSTPTWPAQSPSHDNRGAPPLPPVNKHLSQQHIKYSSTEAQFQDLEVALASHRGTRHPTSSRYIPPRPRTSTTSLAESHEERNPTIQALWKAEYSRLTTIYSQTGTSPNRSDLDQSRSAIASPRLTHQFPSQIEIPASHSPTLRSMSHQSYDSDRRLPSTSHLDLDQSDCSSNMRYSLLSSSGASSSFTTRTSIVDECTTTREDVRRIVDDMRMTYLNALEAHTPPLQPLPDLPAQKPRSKKARSLASSASVESGLRSVNRRSGSRVKSWQSTGSSQQSITPRTSTSSPPTKSLSKRKSSGNSRRTSFQPVAGISSLPAIEASPAKTTPQSTEKGTELGLKRADSTTLGSMEKMLTILDDRKSSEVPQPSTPISPRIYVTTEPEQETESVAGEDQSSVITPPRTASSIQTTPVKHKYQNAGEETASIPPPAWHVEAERLFADADVDVSLDVDDFEALCNDLFSTPATAKRSPGTFDTWGRPISATRPPVDGNDGNGTGSPRKRPQTTPGPPKGLGLSILSGAM